MGSGERVDSRSSPMIHPAWEPLAWLCPSLLVPLSSLVSRLFHPHRSGRDTVGKIAKAYYGAHNAANTNRITFANKDVITNPNILHVVRKVGHWPGGANGLYLPFP